jgi:hypothetical protein
MPVGVGHEAAVSRFENRNAALFMRAQRRDGMDEMGAIFLNKVVREHGRRPG